MNLNQYMVCMLFLWSLGEVRAKSSQYAVVGSNVQLICTFHGIDYRNMNWNIGSEQLSFGTLITAYELPDLKPRLNVTVNHAAGEYHLTILDIRKYDEGLYQCIGSANTVIVELIVVVGPTNVSIANKESGKVHGTEDQDLLLSCAAVGGSPAPDMELKIENDVHKKNSSHTIHYPIQKISRSYDGKTVTCQTAYQGIPYTPLVDTAEILLNLKPSIPIFTPTSVSVIENKSIEITCTSTGSRPVAVFKWYIGTANITSSSETGPSTSNQVTSTLRFILTKDHNGQQLTCKATNKAAPTGVAAVPITMDVKYPPVVKLDDETLLEETSPTVLTCNADGNPDAYTAYNWKHESLQGTLIRTLNKTKDGTLTLPNVNKTLRYQNTGRYTCTVGNGIPDTTTKRSGSGILTINAPPVFSSVTRWKQGGKIRKPSNISAYVYSVPNLLNLKWYRGSVEVSGDGYQAFSSQTTFTVKFHGKEIEVNGFLVTLAIVVVKESDFTTYRLRVGNIRGSTEKSIVFESSSAPDPPKNFTVIDQTYHSITVQWEAGYDGGHEQTFYVLYKQQGSGKWITLDVPEGVKGSTNQLHEIEIGGLQHSSTYEIKMFAENAINKSDETGIEEGVTETELVGGPSGADIGGVVGGLSVAVIILIVVVVIVKLRKRSDQNVKQKISRSDSDGGDGLKDNILYKSVDAGSSKPPEFVPSEYAEVQKPSDVYAEVSKPKPQKDTKEKKQKGKKSPGNRKQKPTVKNYSAEEYANQSEYGNVNNSTGGYKNADGLQYADITFIQPPKTKPGKAGKPVIYGLDDRTIYCDVDHAKKAPPLPQEGAYELTDISKQKQS